MMQTKYKPLQTIVAVLIMTLILAAATHPLGSGVVGATRPLENGVVGATVTDTSEVLRLHIIANSDSEFDQSVKIELRDELLPLFEESASYEDARTFLMENGDEIQLRAEKLLSSRGADYGAQLYLGQTEFPFRSYESAETGVTDFPAGMYDALCVVLGSGSGQNWWCVLFPPLCIISRDGEPIELDKLEFESDILNWLRENWGWFNA